MWIWIGCLKDINNSYFYVHLLSKNHGPLDFLAFLPQASFSEWKAKQKLPEINRSLYFCQKPQNIFRCDVFCSRRHRKKDKRPPSVRSSKYTCGDKMIKTLMKGRLNLRCRYLSIHKWSSVYRNLSKAHRGRGNGYISVWTTVDKSK